MGQRIPCKFENKDQISPSYSPNLNLIERLWKFFRKKILYNKYYDTYEKFKTNV
ncbi:MAG: transposase [Planctomycetia bacterium]|nr:transposase [Planctomycetia bacterium]